ncbi:MAG TPA: FtsX-like permease family protein [Solirubrobacteraceae bacterium]|nr:FtsX-like permease family protein [Solirubrobacteraceae bacterium]
MRLRNLPRLYLARLSARWLQECFAIAGIAAGVALLFASQIASDSLSSSPAQLSRGILGEASLQLLSRSPQGIDERSLAAVRKIPGVRAAAPLLEASANAIGPQGSRSVELVGADESLRALGGALVRHIDLAPFGGIEAILLPTLLAHQLGVTKFGAEATLEVAGRVTRAPLYRQLGAAQIGPLANTPIVVTTLAFAQEITALQGRISRVLVVPARGRETQVRAALRRLAGRRVLVEPASYDERLFNQAASASNQSTALFAVISALVGFLFAFDAMLLTVPQRQRLISELRCDGYTPAAAAGVLLFDALVLGTIGCIAGLALGDELSIHVFASTPGYLSSAFAVGSSRVVSLGAAAIAAAGGMLAAVIAVLSPMRRVLSRPSAVERAGGTAPLHGMRAPSAAGLVCLAVAGAILLVAPQLAIVAMISLTLALLALLSLTLRGALALVARAAPTLRSAIPHVAVMELRASRTRAAAIAATGAVAIFGSVSIQGAHADLQRGLEDAAHDMNAFTQLWVAPAGSFDLLMTQPFSQTALGRLRHLHGVAAVRLYRGSLLDWGERRTWIIAPPAGSTPLIPPSQILEGSLAGADAHLRHGGWAVLSQALASEHRVRIGQTFTLPAPRPLRLRLAAISTNIGWAPGAVILNDRDYVRAWGTTQPSAYDVQLDPGASQEAVRRAAQATLGPGSGLAVQTAAQHAGKQRALTRQGLQRLTQIADLILTAAVLAMAAAVGGMIWQRRPRLAKLKLEGFSPNDLWATVLIESAVLLATGCVAGAAFGLLGQQVLDRALSTTVNYPVVPSVAVVTALASVGLVTAAAVAILAIPGRLAARVPAALALEE